MRNVPSLVSLCRECLVNVESSAPCPSARLSVCLRVCRVPREMKEMKERLRLSQTKRWWRWLTFLLRFVCSFVCFARKYRNVMQMNENERNEAVSSEQRPTFDYIVSLPWWCVWVSWWIRKSSEPSTRVKPLKREKEKKRKRNCCRLVSTLLRNKRNS